MSAVSTKQERWSHMQDDFDRLQALLGSIDNNYQQMIVQMDSTTTVLKQMVENQQVMTKQLEATGQILAGLSPSLKLLVPCVAIPPADKMLANSSTVYLNQNCKETLESMHMLFESMPFEVTWDEEIQDYIDNTHEGLLRQLALGVDDKNTKGSAHVLLDAMCSLEVAPEVSETLSLSPPVISE